jgi:hypothetical protein
MIPPQAVQTIHDARERTTVHRLAPPAAVGNERPLPAAAYQEALGDQIVEGPDGGDRADAEALANLPLGHERHRRVDPAGLDLRTQRLLDLFVQRHLFTPGHH